jgi:hypothetical protein
MMVIANAAAGAEAEKGPPPSLVGAVYSIENGSMEMYFIDSGKVDMASLDEKLGRTYSYDASSGTGKIISGEPLSAEIYSFTIKNAANDLGLLRME